MDFDRVMIYRFCEDNSGEVYAESLRDTMEPYLGLRYPEGDIPQQARDLYVRNLIRIIPDVSYTPVPLFAFTDIHTEAKQLDLSDSLLRSVSPIHIEYLKNMGVAASFSVSILCNQRLWGLISCHHLSPKILSANQRQICLLYSKLLSSQLEVHLQAESLSIVTNTDLSLGELFKVLTKDDFNFQHFIHNNHLTQLVNACGVVAFLDGILCKAGQTPPDDIIEKLSNYFKRNLQEETFVSEQITTFLPEIELYQPQLAGILYCSLEKKQHDYIMWLKPEQIHTITWAGQPPQPDSVSGNKPLTPRSSFAAWQQLVKGQSEKWHPYQINAAMRLASTLQRVLSNMYQHKKQEELNLTNLQLQNTTGELEAFSYTIAHDLRAPLRSINAYTSILISDKENMLDPQYVQMLKDITRNATQMGLLIDSLLEFSRIGHKDLVRTYFNMQDLVQDVLLSFKDEVPLNQKIIKVNVLPNVVGDHILLRQVWTNLISNAIKYTQYSSNRQIEIGAFSEDNQIIYFVKDNGAGFDMKYYNKLYGVFHRLHDVTLFKGTGIGLAIVKKIVERHNGKVWATAVPNVGATFFFSLPIK